LVSISISRNPPSFQKNLPSPGACLREAASAKAGEGTPPPLPTGRQAFLPHERGRGVDGEISDMSD